VRTENDAARSLARYTSEILGSGWEIRYAEVPEVFSRPFGVVGPAGPSLDSPGSAGAHYDVIMPCSIHLWPSEGDDPESALLEALEVKQTLATGIRVGVGVGGPRRVPLWDYDGVGINEDAVVRGLSDYLRVNDFSTDCVRDEEDPRVYEVVSDIRLGWRARGRVPSGAPVRSVRQRPQTTT
jgi:hypothetical protein